MYAYSHVIVSIVQMLIIIINLSLVLMDIYILFVKGSGV